MINRDLYKGSFSKDNIPSWSCPTCNSGIITTTKEKFLDGHTASTTAIIKEDWFDPEDMAELIYTVFLQCSNPKCLEIVMNVGSGFVERDYDEHDWSWISYFKPKFFYPPLMIFQIPKNTPENVRESIISSFSLVFTNPASSANQIRIAIECLLTHLKVKQYHIVKGKRNKLTLHRRIELLPEKYKKIKEVCLAIKWLGNAGSHCEDKITFDDVFDGYDMLSFVLEELYDNKHAHVKKLANKINARKGV